MLVNFIQQQKLLTSLERNLLQAESLEKKLEISAIFAHQKLKSEMRPSNIVRFYEKTLKAHKSIMNLEKEQVDPMRQVEFEFTDKVYNVKMVYYVALDYANEKKYPEAHQVLLRAQTDLEATLEFAAKNNLKARKVQVEVEKLQGLVDRTRELMGKVVSKLLIQKQEHMSAFEKQMGQMNVEQASQLKIDNIFDMLFDSQGNAKEEHMQDKLVFTTS